MEKHRHLTTTKTLPADVEALYELTEPLEGGPVFALPHYGQSSVDFSKMELDVAAALVQAGCPFLRLRKTPKVPKV